MFNRICIALVITVAAGSAAAQCPDPANWVTNCGFEVNDDDWLGTKADSIQRSTAAARTGVASLLCDALQLPTEWKLIVETCVNVGPYTHFDAGGFLKLQAGSGVQCRVIINEFELDDCVDFWYGYWNELAPIDAATWSMISALGYTDMLTESLYLGIECIADDADFQVYLDDAFWGDGIDFGIFADGFESGNTSAWD